ncbi:MAG: polysaccharide biosynthesis tyrosine autokinase [Catalinimonas sp.]
MLLLRNVLRVTLKRWYFVLASVLICLAVAKFYNRYAVPNYELSATIQVNKSDNSLDPMELIFNRSGKAQGGKLMDETVLLTSIPLMQETVSHLDFTVTYYRDNPLGPVELYKDSPIQLKIDTSSTAIPFRETWRCRYSNNERYEIENERGTWGDLLFGEVVNVEGYAFTIKLKEPVQAEPREILFRVNRLDDLVSTYRKKLQVRQIFEQSNVFNLTVAGQNVSKEEDFLNMLLQKIIEMNMASKRTQSDRTAEFLEQQLGENSDSLNLVEGDLARFKHEIVPVNPNMEGGQIYANIQLLEQEKANIRLSDKYYEYLVNTLNNAAADDNIVAPSAMGVEDPLLSNMISRLVEMQLQVRLLLNENKGQNPVVQESMRTISGLKDNILSSVRNQRSANDIRLQDLNRRIGSYQTSLNQMPEAARELVNIEREYRVNEELYLLLMQKRLEAGISSAAVSSDYRIVNRAYISGGQFNSPLRNYLVAIFLGLFVPIGIIGGLSLMNDQIESKEQVQAVTPLAIMASLPHSSKRRDNSGEVKDAFRLLRVQMRALPYAHQAVMITSAGVGDGKTYVSRGLAHSLAQNGHRVLLIDADLRKQSIYARADEFGLSSCLRGESTLSKAIVQHEAGYSLLPSGPMIDNPAEHLASERMGMLMKGTREAFDYVLIDTPPTGIFSDALEILSLVEHTFIVVRRGHTHQSILQNSSDKFKTLGVKRITLIWNDVRDKAVSEGYEKYYKRAKV